MVATRKRAFQSPLFFTVTVTNSNVGNASQNEEEHSPSQKILVDSSNSCNMNATERNNNMNKNLDIKNTTRISSVCDRSNKLNSTSINNASNNNCTTNDNYVSNNKNSRKKTRGGCFSSITNPENSVSDCNDANNSDSFVRLNETTTAVSLQQDANHFKAVVESKKSKISSLNLHHSMKVTPQSEKKSSKANPVTNPSEINPVIQRYNVLYAAVKRNAKSKGPWSDGLLTLRGISYILSTITGKSVASVERRSKDLPSIDGILQIGKFHVEIMRAITEEEYLSGAAFDTGTAGVMKKSIKRASNLNHEEATRPSNCAESNAAQLQLQEDALILNEEQLEYESGATPVIVDRHMASRLRPHQREGVKFLYECVMGLRNPLYQGCLLADAMGLGKTLQVITLIWTLLKQGPNGKPAVRKAIVVCPSSLVENWGKEVRKWLGTERLKALVVHAGSSSSEAKSKLSDFTNSSVWPLLITSYELLRKHTATIAAAKAGLLVCDEGHRLKNSAGNKTTAGLMALGCPKRILLTGTPVQNDLNEFYAMMDFVNPKILGQLATFKKLYSDPISRSHDRDASNEERELGRARSNELQKKVKTFVLRRTANTNKQYLPAKQEYIVFCKFQPSQLALYKAFLKTTRFRSFFEASGSMGQALAAISILRKLSNHPDLVRESAEDGHSCKQDEELHRPSLLDVPFTNETLERSGKMKCLEQLLQAVLVTTGGEGKCDRVVIVSNFTQTLNLIQELCKNAGWEFCRLDGSTDVAVRQAMVDKFNSGGREFVFLLSSKAGGTGLNLIGANRLILFDPDWNPATDAQAMARVWREGQRKAVVIYRFLTTGSIEEKIYQRQIVKGEAAAAVGSSGGGVSGGRHFSHEELKELFTLREDTKCDTFDLLSRSSIPAAERWRDHSSEIEDEALAKTVAHGGITFVQRHIEDVGNLDDIINNAELDVAVTMEKNATDVNASRRGCDSRQSRTDTEETYKGEPCRKTKDEFVCESISYGRTESRTEGEAHNKNMSNCTLSTDNFSTTASAASALAWSLKPRQGAASKFTGSFSNWSDEAMETPQDEGGKYDDDNFSL